MMNRKTLSVGLAAIVAMSFVACQSDSGGGGAAVDSSTAAIPAEAYTPGVMANEYDVKSHNAVADSGASTAAELAVIYAEFPKLGALDAEVSSFTRIVMTEAGNFEAYNGSDLIAAFSVSGSNLSVIWAKEGFNVDSASYSLEAEAQQAPHGDMTFKLKECYEKEQEQEQGKNKEQKSEEVCEGLTVVITFEGETPKQEQEQKGKEATPSPAPTAAPTPTPAPPEQKK